MDCKDVYKENSLLFHFIWTVKVRRQPAESFDEVSGTLGDLLGKLDHVDASQDDVIGLHGIRA